ncbi:MAG TPA: cohesin domain-containing protein [Pyrinomonadaceae bacterium]
MRLLAIAIGVLLLGIAFGNPVAAQTITFETPTYAPGSINAQDGWSATGSAPASPGYDHAVVVNSSAPVSFGAQSLRISNKVTSGSFGDQTFSKSVYNEAGESTAQNNGYSGGVRQNHFEAEFSLASADPNALQAGLLMSIAPDRGDGARMSYLRFEDQADGIHVFFDDYQDAAPFGASLGDAAGCGAEDDFIETDIVTLNRTVEHSIKIVMDLYEGTRNDVVKIYIDGTLKHTGTSWEDYFRYCEGNPTRTVDSLLFRTSGTAHPELAGKGYLIDNMTLNSGQPPTTQTIGAGSLSPSTWFFYNDETDVIDNSLGSFVLGPGTAPLGTGSAQISVSGTQRRNLATFQFAGTPLASISVLKFSTYNPSAGNGGSPNRSAYLNFNVDFTGSSTSFQRRLVYVPVSNGTVIQNQWQEWDAINGGAAKYSYSGATWPAGIGGGGESGTTLKTWSQLLSQYPNARILPSDPFLGLRVGEPYPDGYTENIDAFKFGTAAGTKQFNFDPQASTVYVDDNWVGTTLGSDPDGAGPATGFGYDAFATIQNGIDGVATGGTVNVAAGTYNEDVLVNKDNLVVSGAGAVGTTIVGPIGGSASTVAVAANNVEVRGFKITRAGNNTTDWNNAGLNTVGLSVQGGVTGMKVHDNLFTGNRSGIDINNSSGHTVRNNVIDDNRTGMIMRNQTDNLTVVENQVTNNWTVGILFLDASSGSNSPVQTALNCTFFNNNLSSNWYGGIVDRQSGGSIPAPGTTNLKNFSGNWYGTSAPAVTTANSAEPGYAAQIPVEFGGAATNPGGAPDIAGPASANFDYSPFLNFGGDTNIETTPGRGTYGFQGNFSALNISATSAQTGGLSKIQEAINLISVGGTLTVPPGTYAGNVDVNKVMTINGSFTVSGTFTVSAVGATVSPGNTPGIINTGNLSLTAGSNLNIELNGTAPGTGYDQINVTGTVSLGGANLNVTTGFTPAIGNSFVIVDNDDGDPVSGAFNGLPEGAVFYVGTNSFRISYAGGTGNDVVLTAVSLCNAVSISNSITTLTGVPVTVPLTVDDTTGNGLLSYDFTLNYNPSVVTYTGFDQSSTVSSGMSVLVNSSTPGVLVVSAFQSGPLSGAGTLLKLNFNAVGSPGASSPMNFSSFKFNEGTPCLSVTNGLVTIISGTITGTITYGNAINSPLVRGVPNATLNAVGSVNVMALTNAAGAYSLSGMGSGAYTVTPSKSGGVNNALSGMDSALIAQHVVGLITLNATQQTVGDVSGTGGLTSFDAALIARYVVALPNSGSAGSWRFTPVNRSYPNVNTNSSGQDYVALLMGDVSGNWNDPTSLRLIGSVRKPLHVAAGNISVSPNSEVVVPISINSTTGKAIVAYQFELAYDPAVLMPSKRLVQASGTLSNGLVITTNDSVPGLLKVVVFGANQLYGDGLLLNLRFTAIGETGSTSALTWQNFIANEGSPRTVTTDGLITISPASADELSISGTLLTATGQGVPKALVTLTDMNGESRTIISNASGFYQFGNVERSHTYTITVESRSYIFAPVTVNATDNLANVNLISQP